MNKPAPPKKQLLHFVFGGELKDLSGTEFKNLDQVELVGLYPDHASAVAAWRSKAQASVDNAQMRILWLTFTVCSIPRRRSTNKCGCIGGGEHAERTQVANPTKATVAIDSERRGVRFCRERPHSARALSPFQRRLWPNGAVGPGLAGEVATGKTAPGRPRPNQRAARQAEPSAAAWQVLSGCMAPMRPTCQYCRRLSIGCLRLAFMCWRRQGAMIPRRCACLPARCVNSRRSTFPNLWRFFLDHWRPDVVLVAQSEFWPNLIIETNRRGIPLALVNGKLSARAFLALAQAARPSGRPAAPL